MTARVTLRIIVTRASAMTAARSSIYNSARVRSIYRQLLTLIRNTEPQAQQQQYKAECVSAFHSNLNNSSTAVADEADVAVALKIALEKLSYLKMMTPKFHHRSAAASHLDTRAAAAAAATSSTSIPAHRHSTGGKFHINADGEFVQKFGDDLASTSSRVARANLGITGDELRKHHDLTERMNFRGAFWEGKGKSRQS